MTPKVWTAGYRAWRVATFINTVRALGDCVVLDVRLSPRSIMPMWNKGYLCSQVPYLHVPAWGNPFFKQRESRTLAIQDFDEGFQEFCSLDHANVILLCACAEYESCHRSLLAEALQERGYEVDELPRPSANESQTNARSASRLEMEADPTVEREGAVMPDSLE